MELVSKEELLKEYKVEASFYNVKIKDFVFECRSQARIKRKNVNTKYFDAVLIMVNPGSCNPSNQNVTIPEIDPRNKEIRFIKAESDSTQWQIMRLMKLKNWNQVNIINLSDLCTGSLEVFNDRLKTVKKLSYTHHSIFSDEREQELKSILDSNKGPIILGWGTKSFIRDDAEKALKHPLINRYIGWAHDWYPFYYHPNQRLEKGKKEWLNRIKESIDNLEIKR